MLVALEKVVEHLQRLRSEAGAALSLLIVRILNALRVALLPNCCGAALELLLGLVHPSLEHRLYLLRRSRSDVEFLESAICTIFVTQKSKIRHQRIIISTYSQLTGKLHFGYNSDPRWH